MSYLTVDDGVNLYYDDSGVGEALIFCHGLNSAHNINESFYLNNARIPRPLLGRG